MLGGNNLMNRFFKVSVLGLLMVVLTAVSFSTAMAQDDLQAEKTALYNKFLKHYDKLTIEDKEAAIAAAKEYNTKYNKPEDKQLNDYFSSAIPDLEKWVKEEKERVAKKEQADARNKRLARLNTAYNGINSSPNDAAKWDEYFAAGDDVLKYEPDFVDVTLVLASGGSEIPKELQSDSKYKNLTLKYATKAISQLESGVKSNGDKYGEFRWVYGSKDKALTWMNIITGSIKGQSDLSAAIPYYYKAIGYNEGSKNWDLYRLIGQWYRNKAVEIGKEREKLDLKVEENIPQIKEYLAMERGYVQRAIDAYARSYNLAKSDSKADAKQKTALYNTLKDLFAFRYSEPKDADKKTDMSINSYISSVASTKMPNPESEVQPIRLEEDKPADSTEGDSTSTDMKTGATKTDTNKTTPKATAPKTSMPNDVKKEATKTPEVKNGTTRTRTVSKAKVKPGTNN